jgi:hypothetical protein
MQSLSIISKSYDVYKSIVEMNHHLPRQYRFGVGLSTENSMLNLLELLIMAKHAPKPTKSVYLIKANATLEIIRIKLRLFIDLKLVNATKVFQIQSVLQEIGRMLGGWLKSL